MDEIGDNLAFGEALTQRMRDEHMKQLSGEPYSVYIGGVGWVPSEQVNTEGSTDAKATEQD